MKFSAESILKLIKDSNTTEQEKLQAIQELASSQLHAEILKTKFTKRQINKVKFIEKILNNRWVKYEYGRASKIWTKVCKRFDDKIFFGCPAFVFSVLPTDIEGLEDKYINYQTKEDFEGTSPSFPTTIDRLLNTAIRDENIKATIKFSEIKEYIKIHGRALDISKNPPMKIKINDSNYVYLKSIYLEAIFKWFNLEELNFFYYGKNKPITITPHDKVDGNKPLVLLAPMNFDQCEKRYNNK